MTKLRQTYGVQKSPAMMKLLKFFYPTLKKLEIGKHLENQIAEVSEAIEEIAMETGKDIDRVRANCRRNKAARSSLSGEKGRGAGVCGNITTQAAAD